MRKEHLKHLLNLMVFRYIEWNISKTEFESRLSKAVRDKSLTSQEVLAVKKHFEKEVYPVDKKVIVWMLNNWPRSSNVNFKSNVNQFKKIIK